MKLQKIIKYLEKKFPNKKAEKWDKVGIQKFNSKPINLDSEIQDVFVTMDLNSSALNKIKERKYQLVITRHPFIFNDLKKEKTNHSKNQIIKYLTKNNILVYSIHTNYDYCAYNDFVSLLKSKLEIKKINKDFFNKKFLKINLNKLTPINLIIENLKLAFKSSFTKINFDKNLENKIDLFYINQGSGAGVMIENSLENCVFITGEAKWSDWIYANDNNITLITLGHYMENYFVNFITNKLSNNFKDIKITSYDIKEQFKIV